MTDNNNFIVSKYKKSDKYFVKSKYSIIRKKQPPTPYLSVITTIQNKILKENPNITSIEYEKEFIKIIYEMEKTQKSKTEDSKT
jgi:hypothetical protein